MEDPSSIKLEELDECHKSWIKIGWEWERADL